MKNKVVLDASVLLTLIQNEKGADVIKPLLENTVMSTVNIAECLTALQRINIQPLEALENITAIISTVIPFDLHQAQMAAELQPQVQHKGLSLGDRACIALGIQLQLPIYTADKIWKELNIEDADIKLIR